MYSTLITLYLAQGPVYSKHLINVWLLFTVHVHAQSCPILCNLTDCSSPGPSIQGISQARILKWVAISYFRGSSRHRDWTYVSWVSCIAGRFLTPGTSWEAPSGAVAISIKRSLLLGLDIESFYAFFFSYFKNSDKIYTTKYLPFLSDVSVALNTIHSHVV